jgi:hypothetical protein
MYNTWHPVREKGEGLTQLNLSKFECFTAVSTDPFKMNIRRVLGLQRAAA